MLAPNSRIAVGITKGNKLVFAMTRAPIFLGRLAKVMKNLGCVDAMNLDGGGSTTLVHRGHLLNRPYSEQDQPAPASRPIVSAIVVERR